MTNAQANEISQQALQQLIIDKIPPYADSLGIALDGWRENLPVLACDFEIPVIGRPGFYHGGALSGLMEIAAICALRVELARQGRVVKAKQVNISISFQRGGRAKRCFAIGEVTRLGQRTANVRAHCWQDDPEKPIAAAFMNFMLSRPKA